MPAASRTTFLAALASQPALILSYPEFLTLVHEQKYTGAFTVHCIHGVPTSVQLDHDPVRIGLSRGAVVDSRK